MTVCKICNEEYSGAYDKCPFCGCSGEWVKQQNWKYPESISSKYELYRVDKINETFPDGLYWNSEKQNLVRIQKILPTDEGENCYSFIARLSNDEKWHPMIYELVRPENGKFGYYICSYEEGELLMEILEKENPPNQEMISLIENGVQKLLMEVEKKESDSGIFDLSHLKIKKGEDGIVISNFGSELYRENHREQVEKMLFRIKNGYWREENKDDSENFFRQLLGKYFR